MAKYELFRRDSGEVMIIIVCLFVGLSFYLFRLSYSLIVMGVKGDFSILAGFTGFKLYFASISPGLALAAIMAAILILGLPNILHSQSDAFYKKQQKI